MHPPTRNSKLETRNSKLETRNSKLETRNSKLETPIPLSQPDITDLERDYVLEVLESSQLAMGPWKRRFEDQMASLCRVKHAIAVSSGTAALHLITRGLGLGAGDEVITTPFSFVASSNCLLYENVRPRFVDIDPETLALDPGRIEEACTPATRAILAVDVFGAPAPWPELEAIANRRDLLLIDDACEAPGASVGGRPIGAWGRAAAFGFYPNKQVTTGEGGCITTNDGRLAETCRSMANQGRATEERMEHVLLGYNYRMDEMSAALGCAQLERLPELLTLRRRAAGLYAEALADLEADLVLPVEVSGAERSWFVYVIRLKPSFEEGARDIALRLLRDSGIGCAVYFPSIHLQPLYRERFGFRPGDFPICESISERCLALPFFPSVQPEQISRVATALKAILPQLPRRVKTY